MAKTFTVDFFGNDNEQPLTSGEPYVSCNGLINYIASLASGARVGTARMLARNDCTSATGTLTLAAATGAVGGTLNGVLVTVVASGGDTATAAALAAAFNASADPLIAGHLTAASVGAVVTLSARNPGVSGNAITLAASGTGVTASGTRLTGGAETRFQFNF